METKQTVADFNKFSDNAPMCAKEGCKNFRDVMVEDGTCYYLPLCYSCVDIIRNDDRLMSLVLGEKIPCNKEVNYRQIKISEKRKRKDEFETEYTHRDKNRKKE